MKGIIFKAALGLAFVSLMACLGQGVYMKKLQERADSAEQSKVALLEDMKIYQVRDSLQAAQVYALNMSVNELKKYREEDYQLIKDLKLKAKEVDKFTTVETIVRDTITTVVYNKVIKDDTTYINLSEFNYKDEFTDVNGHIRDDSITLDYQVKAPLKIVETVKYKRFLGFLWKTNKVKSRNLNVVSLNPRVQVGEVEYLNIE